MIVRTDGTLFIDRLSDDIQNATKGASADWNLWHASPIEYPQTIKM